MSIHIKTKNIILNKLKVKFQHYYLKIILKKK